MVDLRRVVMALVLMLGLSLAGGYSYATLSDEDSVQITIDASDLDGSDDSGSATEAPTETSTQAPTGTETTTGTPTETETKTPTKTTTEGGSG